MKSKNPIILVPARSVNPQSDISTGFVHGVWDSYIRKLGKYSITPIIVPLGISYEALSNLADLASGLFLTGGDDINPKVYGQNALETTRQVCDARDDVEIFLSKEFLRKRKPILGICRGCQMLAVVDQGTLHQQIPESINKVQHTSKKRGSDMTRHDISIDLGTNLYNIVGKSQISVNSSHHQSISSVGANFKITARSLDGVIEAIEHIDPSYFCLGVQSHPEAEENDLEGVFPAFIEACKLS